MSEPELKPCAHCGEVVNIDSGSRIFIRCKCGIETKYFQYLSSGDPKINYENYLKARNELIEAWNRRA